jgi:hypothetical protein
VKCVSIWHVAAYAVSAVQRADGPLGRMQECLASLGAVTGEAAVAVLLAVWPLCRVRRHLQDRLVLTLRKLMFSHDVPSRSALLLLLLLLLLVVVGTAGRWRQLLLSSPLPQLLLVPRLTRWNIRHDRVLLIASQFLHLLAFMLIVMCMFVVVGSLYLVAGSPVLYCIAADAQQ